MDETVLPSKLLTVLHTAAEHIRGQDFIHIFSHDDADGISSAGILARMLQRMGKEYQIAIVPAINDEVFETIRESLSDCILLSDLGASYVDRFEDIGKDVIILDHHKTDLDSDRVVYANPHLYGIDGMTSACGATLSFLLSITVDQNNWDLVELAFAGIAGDREHINGLSGPNAYLFKGAEERGLITRIGGSLVPPGQLSNSLFTSTEPYVRGISGNAPEVQNLLNDAGISNDRGYRDLSDDERWKLSSLIAIRLLKQGVSVRTLEETSRPRYVLKDWGMDAESLADILNSCCKNNSGGLGVGVCLGDAKCMEDALQINRARRNAIVESVNALDRIGLTQMENIQFFDNEDAGSTSILCGVAMQFIADQSKPTIGINAANEKAKASSRGNWALIEKGLNLTTAMGEAARSVGGSGGGHRIASGASFPRNQESAFLLNLDRIVGEQLSGAR